MSMGTALQYALLRRFFPRTGAAGPDCASEVSGRRKLETMLGPEVLAILRGRSVLDFGCGEGLESIALAEAGAGYVTGIDIQEEGLRRAQARAELAGVGDRCEFTSVPGRAADYIISLDAFEHFSGPLEILELMEKWLAPGGQVLISFGPTWYHPLGGHTFSVFPWAHLLFSEAALIRWRSDFKSDGATRFGEVAGGLNQMTIRRFEELVDRSPFRLASFELVPVRPLAPLHGRWTREWTTAVVRCRLERR